jgi:quercetin dioxygenase-like cupin family protein
MIFSKNADTSALAMKSVEGKAIAGTLFVRPLIKGEEMSLMEVQLSAGVASPPHAHDHESLIYVVKGRLKAVVGDMTLVLGPGDVCRHPRGVSHFLEALEESTFVEIKSPAPDLTRVLGK